VGGETLEGLGLAAVIDPYLHLGGIPRKDDARDLAIRRKANEERAVPQGLGHKVIAGLLRTMVDIGEQPEGIRILQGFLDLLRTDLREVKGGV